MIQIFFSTIYVFLQLTQKQFFTSLDIPLGSLAWKNPKARVIEKPFFTVWPETVVDFVAKGCTVIVQTHILWGNVHALPAFVVGINVNLVGRRLPNVFRTPHAIW